MHSFFRTLVVTSCIAVAGIFFPTAVSAQQAVGVQIQPAIIEESANPGDVLTKSVTIRNVSDIEQTYYLTRKDISGVAANSQPVFAEEGAEPTGFELSSWVNVTAEPIVVGPGASVDLPVTINVPASATPGSHFGGLFVTIQPPRLRESGASVGYEVGTIISIRISGDVTESARIRAFSTDKLAYGSPEVTFTTRVENPGNVLIRPRGPLEIYNMFGKRVNLITVNDSLGGVFPGTTRDFETVWKSEDFAIGRYQGVIGLLYGEKGRETTVSATVSFWILPLNVILPILGMFAFVVLAVYFGIRIHIKRTLDRYQIPSRRGRVYRRRDAGITRLSLVAIAILTVTALFLIILLFLMA